MTMTKYSRITKYTISLFLFVLFALPLSVFSQDHKPPLPVELLFGHDHLYFQMVLKKQFTPESRLGFFSVATYSAKYNDLSDVDITLPMHLYYDVWKGFSVIGGGAINSVTGFSPYAGFEHNFASRQVLTVTQVNFSLDSHNDFTLFGIYEYKPPINENWSLFTHLQLLYNTSFKDGAHNRSYLYLRAGISRGSIGFGLGANLDQYGPYKTYEDNYGLFVMYEFR